MPESNLPVARTIDLLKLSEHERREVLARIRDDDDVSAAASERRAHRRFRVSRVVSASFTTAEKRVQQVWFRAVVFDLSERSVGLLHCGFLYPGTRVSVLLASPDGERLDLPGEVRRCSHVQGRVHELGVVFEQTIDPVAFIQSHDVSEAGTTTPPQGQKPSPRAAGTPNESERDPPSSDRAAA